jgi:hypothetical protein
MGFRLDTVRDSAILSVYQTIHHLHKSDCAGSYCCTGRCIWDWYFSLSSSAIKQVLVSNPASAFRFIFPHFVVPQITRYENGLYVHITLHIKYKYYAPSHKNSLASTYNVKFVTIKISLFFNVSPRIYFVFVSSWRGFKISSR